MREIDFQYGELLLKDIESEKKDNFDKYMSREQEIKSYCNQLIQEGTVESISRLILLVFEHDVGANVAGSTNWGGILRLALNILVNEEKKEKSIIFKVNNLEQLIYIFRTMRFLNYRWQITGEEKYKEELEMIFDQFEMSEFARKEVLRASTFEKAID